MKLLIALVFAVASIGSAQGQMACSSGFTATGACGVSLNGYSLPNAFLLIGGPNVGANMSGSQLNMIPSGANHSAVGLIYQTPVNVQAFTSTFTFVPNGWNIAFVIENNTNLSGNGGTSATVAVPNKFAAGAGCEAGFYQAFNGVPPNNIIAMELDQVSPLANTNGLYLPFVYSSTQVYTAGESPCNPNDLQPNYVWYPKYSTSPVPLNSPANTAGTTTGDTYSVTMTYDGTNLGLSMYDVTAGGSCPGAACFTYLWPENIPALVGGSTAYVGLTGGTNSTSIFPLVVTSMTFGPKSVAPPPPIVTTTALTETSPAITAGQLETLTATVAPSTATGAVTFLNGTASLGVANLASGVAALMTNTLPVGTNSITASYAGATGFDASVSAPVVVTVAAPQTATTTSLAATVNQSVLTLNATVTGNSPTGTLTFLDGTTILGTANVLSGSFSPTLAAGAHSLTVSYSGDANNLPSTSAAIPVTVATQTVTTTQTSYTFP